MVHNLSTALSTLDGDYRQVNKLVNSEIVSVHGIQRIHSCLHTAFRPMELAHSSAGLRIQFTFAIVVTGESSSGFDERMESFFIGLIRQSYRREF